MEPVFLIVVLVNTALVVVLAVMLSRTRREIIDNQRRLNMLGALVKQSQDTSTHIRHDLGAVWQHVHESGHQVAHGLGEVKSLTQQVHQSSQHLYKEFGSMSETTRQILDMRADIAGLKDLLQSSKRRGKLGEVLLAAILEDALPDGSYKLQYAYRNGLRVDAVIRLHRGIVPIDSKFPLTNYEAMLTASGASERAQHERLFASDVRKHIDAVAQYIAPGEGTLDFALMFVPSEAVYYEIVTASSDGNPQSLSTYAFEQRVFPVSPSTFYPYLLTIARGLREMYVADHIQATLREIEQLQREFEQQRQKWETARRQIDNARNNLADVQAGLDTISELIKKIVTPIERPLES